MIFRKLLFLYACALLSCGKQEPGDPRDCALPNSPSAYECRFAFETGVSIGEQVLLDEYNRQLIFPIRSFPPNSQRFLAYFFNYETRTFAFQYLNGTYNADETIALQTTLQGSRLIVPARNGVRVYDAGARTLLDDYPDIIAADGSIFSCFPAGQAWILGTCNSSDTSIITYNPATRQITDGSSTAPCSRLFCRFDKDTAWLIAPSRSSQGWAHLLQAASDGRIINSNLVSIGSQGGFGTEMEYRPADSLLISLQNQNLRFYRYDAPAAQFSTHPQMGSLKANDWLLNGDTLYVAHPDWYLECYLFPSLQLIKREKLPREPRYLCRLQDGRMLVVYVLQTGQKTEVYYSIIN